MDAHNVMILMEFAHNAPQATI